MKVAGHRIVCIVSEIRIQDPPPNAPRGYFMLGWDIMSQPSLICSQGLLEGGSSHRETSHSQLVPLSIY